MKNRSKAATGVLLTTLSALLYGTLPVFANLSYAAGSNAETFNFYKSAWAIPPLAVLVLLRRQSVRLPKRLALWAVLAGVLGKGITSLFLFLSYNYVSGGVATTLHFMYPLFAALLGWVFFHERLPLYKWLTLLVSTLAVSLFVDAGSGAASLTGVFYALASAVVYAVFIVVIDKSGIAQLDPFVFAAVSGWQRRGVLTAVRHGDRDAASGGFVSRRILCRMRRGGDVRNCHCMLSARHPAARRRERSVFQHARAGGELCAWVSVFAGDHHGARDGGNCPDSRRGAGDDLA